MRTLEMWLGLLTPIRWIMVAGMTVLPLIAGATILTDNDLFGSHARTVTGIFALTAAILSGIHTAFHCDAHQQECRQMIGIYGALEAAFQDLQRSTPEQIASNEKDIEERYEEAVRRARGLAPSSFRSRASKEATNK